MTDISSIVLNTTNEGRNYDILLDGITHDGEKVVVTILTDSVIVDTSNVAIVLTSTVEGNLIKVELTDENMISLLGTDTSAALQFIVRKGSTKVGSKLITLNKEKLVVPSISFFSDQGNNSAATVIFDIDYGSFTPYHVDSSLSSVIVEYHIEGDGDATVIEFISGVDLVIDSNNQASIIILNLTNDYLYEYIVTGKNSAGETNSITGKVRPTDQPNAPTISNIDSIVVGDIPDASNVDITITWQDIDAAGYESIGGIDGSNSTIKLRIGTDTDISNNQAIYDVSNISQIYEVFLTNAQLGDAVAGLTLNLSNINIIAMDANASTTGVILRAQMLPVSMTDLEDPGKSGVLSNTKTAFIDTVPTIVPIQVTVDGSTGTQTFYVNGTVPSEDNSGVSLTIDNSGSRITDLSGIYVLTDDSINIIEAHTDVSYNDLSGNPVITATLSQVDRNGTLDSSNIYVYSAIETFNTIRFKTPTAPNATDSLFKNNIGNDGNLQAKYQTSDLNDMNGYNLVNVTGVINELADVSGVFDTAVDLVETSHVKSGANQTIDISGDYVVDSSYTMILKKGYALDSTVYSTYEAAQKDTSVTDISAGVIDSANSDAVFYMGNPEITHVVVSGASDTVTVSVSTHGTDLTDDKAVTLVLVAKDVLAGYAGGGLSGNMGSTVLTLDSNDSQVTGYDSVTADSGNQSVIATFDLSNVIITDDATSVIIVDATNAHSAISLSNFPDSAVIDASFNSATE